METKLKQRLIGAAVLVGLGVIFIPMLFEHSDVVGSTSIVTSEIPPTPQPPKVVNINLPAAPEVQLASNQANNAVYKSELQASANASEPRENVAEQSNVNDALSNKFGSNLQTFGDRVAPNTDQATNALRPNTKPNLESSGNKSNSLEPIQQLREQMNEIKDMRAKLISQRELLAEEKTALLKQRKMLEQRQAKVSPAVVSKPKQVSTSAASKPKSIEQNAQKQPIAKMSQAQPKPSSPVVHQLKRAWVVQIASFNQQDNADLLKKRLIAKGFASYTRRVSTKTGVHYRVYVGPSVKRKRAEVMMSQLKKVVHLQGIVVNYNSVRL